MQKVNWPRILGAYPVEIKEVEQLLKDQGYFNADNFMTVEQNQPAIWGEGNGLLQTGLLYVIKAVSGALTQKDIDQMIETTRRCLHTTVNFLWRSPHKRNPGDDNEHDDYRGWMPALYFAESDYALKIYRAMEKRAFFVDISNPDHPNPKYWFDRYIGFVPLMKMCARGCKEGKEQITLTVWDHLAAMLMLINNIWKMNPENAGCVKAYTEIAVLRRESWPCTLIAPFWFMKCRKKFGIVGQSFVNQFKSPSHPICLGDWK